jgi:hypothetical protein
VLLVLLIAVCRPTNSIEWNLSHFPDRDHLFSASRFNLYIVLAVDDPSSTFAE